jgi:hypothetical protein
MKKITSKIVLSIVLLVFANFSSAALIKVTFDGTIDQVTAGTYSIGQKLSGFIIYDTDTSISSYPGSSWYPFTTNFGGAINEFELGSQVVENDSSNMISQTSFDSSDNFGMNFNVSGYDSYSGFNENLDLNLVGINLLDNIYELMASPNLSELSSSTFGYTRQKIGLSDGFIQEKFYGSIDTLTITEVPTPISLSLFLLSIIGLIINNKTVASVKA